MIYYEAPLYANRKQPLVTYVMNIGVGAGPACPVLAGLLLYEKLCVYFACAYYGRTTSKSFLRPCDGTAYYFHRSSSCYILAYIYIPLILLSA